MGIDNVGSQMTKIQKIKQIIKNSTSLVSASLVFFGIGILFYARSYEITEANSINFGIIVSLGATLITSGIVNFILSRTTDKIEKLVEEKFLDLDNKLSKSCSAIPIINEANAAGILKIFRCRKENESPITESLLSELENVESGDEVTLMGVSLHSYFIGDKCDKFLPLIVKMATERDILIKILLLDPTSSAAKDRAMIEEHSTVDDDGFTHTAIFKEIMAVTELLSNPRIAVLPPELIEKFKKNVEVRFYKSEPTLLLVKTKSHTYVEQYHRGGNQEIRKQLKDQDGPNVISNFTGYTPVFILDNKKMYAELLHGHVCNLWNSHKTVKRVLTPEYYNMLQKNHEQLRVSENELRCEDINSSDVFKKERQHKYLLNRRFCANLDGDNSLPDYLNDKDRRTQHDHVAVH